MTNKTKLSQTQRPKPRGIRQWFKDLERRVDEGLGYDFSTPAGRRRAKWHFNLIDHGILRILWTNEDEIAPGVWRSNHPSAKRLARYRDMGIVTILNLRGTNKRSHYVFEKEACDKLGLKIVNARLSARKLFPRERYLELLEMFETIERPFLMHCKSGADRAGLASALYLLHIEKRPVEEAQRQLSLKYLHVRSFDTGILDFLLDRYAEDASKTQIPIREWFETRYDPDAITKAYRASTGKSPK